MLYVIILLMRREIVVNLFFKRMVKIMNGKSPVAKVVDFRKRKTDFWMPFSYLERSGALSFEVKFPFKSGVDFYTIINRPDIPKRFGEEYVGHWRSFEIRKWVLKGSDFAMSTSEIWIFRLESDSLSLGFENLYGIEGAPVFNMCFPTNECWTLIPRNNLLRICCSFSTYDDEWSCQLLYGPEGKALGFGNGFFSYFSCVVENDLQISDYDPVLDSMILHVLRETESDSLRRSGKGDGKKDGETTKKKEGK